MLAAGPLVPGGVVKEPTGREGGGRREEGEGNERKEHKGDGGVFMEACREQKSTWWTPCQGFYAHILYIYTFLSSY